MTEIGHAFFRLYSCGRRLNMVIKTLKKTSKSVRRFLKPWGQNFFQIFFMKIELNFEWNPKKFNKIFGPPLYPSPDTKKNFKNIYKIGQSVSDWKITMTVYDWNFSRSPVTDHRTTTLIVYKSMIQINLFDSWRYYRFCINLDLAT